MAARHGNVAYHATDTDRVLLYAHDVHVWIGVPDVAVDDLRDAVDNGIYLLAFDRSARSMQWFQALTTQSAEPLEADRIADHPSVAGHVNGNAWLPAVSADEFAAAADATGHGTVALNHPVPLASEDGLHYAWAWPKTQTGKGRIVVIRDESLPIRLMLGTLDNRDLMDGILKTACAGRHPCRIHLYEPGTARLPETQDTVSQVAQEFGLAERWDRIRENLSHFRDSALAMQDSLRLILALMLLSFLAIAMCIFFSFRRNGE